MQSATNIMHKILVPRCVRSRTTLLQFKLSHIVIVNLICRLFKLWGSHFNTNSANLILLIFMFFLSVHTFILFIKYIYIQLWREKILDKALVDFWSHPWTKKHLQNTWWLMVKSWCTSLVVCYCLLLCVFCAMFVTSYTMTIVYVLSWNIFKIKFDNV